MKAKPVTLCVIALMLFVAAKADTPPVASLKPDAAAVAAGGELTFTASAQYAGTPSALGWAITLPEGWSYVSTVGPDVPAVAPKPGSTGTVEWAFTDVPAGTANFRFIVRAPAAAQVASIAAVVLLRAQGAQQKLPVARVTITVGG